MSASPLTIWAFQTPEESIYQAFRLGMKLGKLTLSKNALLEKLYETSAADIITAAHRIETVTIHILIKITLVLFSILFQCHFIHNILHIAPRQEQSRSFSYDTAVHEVSLFLSG